MARVQKWSGTERKFAITMGVKLNGFQVYEHTTEVRRIAMRE
jgi:hypothetical protein